MPWRGLDASMRRSVSSFDPAASFLLGLRWENLFEPAADDDVTYRCKGCQEVLQISDREKHHRHHVKQAARDTIRRQERIRKERVQVLARARSARQTA